MHFHIDNMICGGCARNVTKVIQSVDARAEVVADPKKRHVEVSSEKPREAFLRALDDAGYPAAAA